MLNSILLHLERAERARAVIEVGVALARQSSARLRGLTLLDTRRAEAATRCEAAVFAVTELRRQESARRQQEQVRLDLSQACLAAGLDFDVRRFAGDPLEVLPREARYHDLVITAVGGKVESRDQGDFTPADALSLLTLGVQPLLVLQPHNRAIERVLLAYDGSGASGQAIRSYLSQGILPDVEHRLVAIGSTEGRARAALGEMVDYCTLRHGALEAGFAVGRLRRVLVPYAEKWQADLVVLGVDRGNRLLRRLAGSAAIDVLARLSCGLYAAA